jgi:tetratricopeptide (TPR) repeat protein
VTVPTAPVADQASHKVVALNLYFADVKELSVADSLLAFVSRSDSISVKADSLGHTGKDSLAIIQDSTKTSFAALRGRLNVDSLKANQARASAGIGELFYTDLANPDSAIFWLKFSLVRQYDEHSAPRILYILSELATSYPDKTTVSAKEYQAQLIRDFPNSYFARQILHVTPDEQAEKKATDPAADAYTAAEALIDAGKNEKALAALKEIIRLYPTSPVAARCRYAIGWLYENRLAKMDSAAAEYKLLIAQYPKTPYALAVNARQLDTLATASVKADTVSGQLLPQTQKKDTVQVGQTSGLNVKQATGKSPGSLSRRARILQSQHGKTTERE